MNSVNLEYWDSHTIRRILVAKTRKSSDVPRGVGIPANSATGDSFLTAGRREHSMNTNFNLQDYGLTVAEVHRNLPPSVLYEHAVRFEKDARIAENGALVAYSGSKTGRSPRDKRVVKHPHSEANVWWGPVNIPLDAAAFAINRERAHDYLNTRDRLYCFDGCAGWDPKYRI